VPVISTGSSNTSLLHERISTLSVTVSGAWKKPSGAAYSVPIGSGCVKSLRRGRRWSGVYVGSLGGNWSPSAYWRVPSTKTATAGSSMTPLYVARLGMAASAFQAEMREIE
jgi:hypothetical protein